MSVDEGFGSEDLRTFREEDPGGFIQVVAAQYHLLVNTGMDSDRAMVELVNQLVDEGINLPLLLDEHPEATRRWFGEHPDFDEAVISDTQRGIDRRQGRDQ